MYVVMPSAAMHAKPCSVTCFVKNYSLTLFNLPLLFLQLLLIMILMWIGGFINKESQVPYSREFVM